MNVKKRKLRVLIVSSIFPSKSGGGGRLAMLRHFVDRSDFEVRVASLDTLDEHVEGIQLQAPFKRFRQTRFSRLARNLSYLLSGLMLRQVKNYIKGWQPDVIYGVPDLEHVGLQQRIVKELPIPFVANFQDLFPVSGFIHELLKPYSLVSRILMSRYDCLARKSARVLHTSQGMKEFFGHRCDASVLYPIGEQVAINPPSHSKASSGPWKIVYAGNCYGPYGEMVLELANALEDESDLTLEVYTMGNDWSVQDVKKHTDSGTLKGFLPFSELDSRLEAADCFLTAMSFSPEDRLFVETSFTTKWLDYAPKSKPIFVWAPEHSSAARFASEFNAGVVIADKRVETVVTEMKQVLCDPAEFKSFSQNAMQVAVDELNSDAIHNKLVECITGLVTQKPNN